MIDPPSSSTVTVAVGGSLTLSCTSQGSPPDTFTWMKDDTPVPLTPTLTALDPSTAQFQSNYSFDSVTESSSGNYTCTVTNPIGNHSQSISVVVVTGKFILLCCQKYV